MAPKRKRGKHEAVSDDDELDDEPMGDLCELSATDAADYGRAMLLLLKHLSEQESLTSMSVREAVIKSGLEQEVRSSAKAFGGITILNYAVATMVQCCDLEVIHAASPLVKRIAEIYFEKPTSRSRVYDNFNSQLKYRFGNQSPMIKELLLGIGKVERAVQRQKTNADTKKRVGNIIRLNYVTSFVTPMMRNYRSEDPYVSAICLMMACGARESELLYRSEFSELKVPPDKGVYVHVKGLLKLKRYEKKTTFAAYNPDFQTSLSQHQRYLEEDSEESDYIFDPEAEIDRPLMMPWTSFRDALAAVRRKLPRDNMFAPRINAAQLPRIKSTIPIKLGQAVRAIFKDTPQVTKPHHMRALYVSASFRMCRRDNIYSEGEYIDTIAWAQEVLGHESMSSSKHYSMFSFVSDDKQQDLDDLALRQRNSEERLRLLEQNERCQPLPPPAPKAPKPVKPRRGPTQVERDLVARELEAYQEEQNEQPGYRALKAFMDSRGHSMNEKLIQAALRDM